MSGRTLVAGIGNVFLGDDGFGVEVVARLAHERLRDGVRVLDTGTRARHLAFELLDGGYQTAILVDAVSRGGVPGTVYLIELDSSVDAAVELVTPADGHAMTPDAMLSFLRTLGGAMPRVLIVGCEPERVDEGMKLSPRVAGAVDQALALLRPLVCV
jgi:hydrogenase maturation protease